ncbi:MAG: DNA alkylation repair protein [Bacteroidales bacterium]|jgi:3-methyladenine DNA glycosylase AlkD|nr:DNA alkylation repair protein [Bacteroidales bacterium]MDD4384301.1 DNA alkylation repair protein [Bacteroidales bacterium]MDY0196748.1 DNA alkylation repair protein [Tenuifilaceae bacterium]
MQVQQIIQEVKRHMNGPVSETLTQHGFRYKVNYGVSVPELKNIARQYTGNHELALTLYEEDIRECKLIASMIDDPKKVTGEQIDDWAQSFNNHEIVEQVCSNLIWKAECALSRSIQWCLSDDEYLQKAGLIIAARNATSTNIKDSVFGPYLDVIDGFDQETFSQQKNSIEFALRQIAMRNPFFRDKVLELAQNFANSSEEHRAWVGSQILYNFADE